MRNSGKYKGRTQGSIREELREVKRNSGKIRRTHGKIEEELREVKKKNSEE
jgi:hypothetical protein